MSGRILFDGTSPKAQSIDAVKAPDGPKTTAEKRAARYARKAREEARWQRQQQQNSTIAAHAEEIAAPCKAEAKRMKEQAAKLPLPQLQGEGKYEARVVQALVEILTGRPTQVRPQKIEMPETIYERIVLILSSTEQFYYRVTASGCTCKGWYYSVQRYGVGYCRHYADAFSEQAAHNKAIIEQIRAERKAQAAEPRDLSRAELRDLGQKIAGQLGDGRYPFLESVKIKHSGIQSISLRLQYRDTLSDEENKQIQAMLAEAKTIAPPGMQINSCW